MLIVMKSECDEAKDLLEFYLLRYSNFIHYFLTQNQADPLRIV